MRSGPTRAHVTRKRGAMDASEGLNTTDTKVGGGENMLSTLSTDDLRERIGNWGAVLRRETRERPGRSAAIAIGAGYFLGGGIFTPLTARLVGLGIRAGLRVALIPFVTQGLMTMGEKLIGGGAAEQDDDDSDDDATADHSTKNQKRNSDQKETHS